MHISTSLSKKGENQPVETSPKRLGLRSDIYPGLTAKKTETNFHYKLPEDFIPQRLQGINTKEGSPNTLQRQHTVLYQENSESRALKPVKTR